MKKYIAFISLLYVTISGAQTKPVHFKSEIDFGNGTVFTTFFALTVDKGQFTISSPEDADVRVVGAKAKLGRAMGKSPKKGILVTITGQQKQDSLVGEAAVSMMGILKFHGTLKDNVLSGKFSREGNTIGTLNGVASTVKRNDYSGLYPKIIKTVADNIFSKSVLQTKEWKKFDDELKELCEKAHDDIEMFIGFNMLSKNLPFSHFNLLISKGAEQEAENQTTAEPAAVQSVVFEEKDPNTAYLQIKNFSTSTEELSEVLPKIVGNANYKNLIVDLRNNPGGGVEAAFEFAKYITNDDIEVGYFVTNKLNYSGFQRELFNTLPVLQPVSTEEFTNDLKVRPGAKLVFKKPNNPVFAGTIYLLTNGKTASTSEPVVYSLKKSKRAIIVGETTAGAMLAAVPFTISENYKILLPIADYYTIDGVRLDKVGVAPDVAVPSDDALNKAMELITNQNK